jgi:hypothetical protein
LIASALPLLRALDADFGRERRLLAWVRLPFALPLFDVDRFVVDVLRELADLAREPLLLVVRLLWVLVLAMPLS